MGTPAIQSIPTMFNGELYRSRLEAQWAVFFTRLGIRYVYEEDGKILRGGDGEEDICYCPDFRLLNICGSEKLYVEVKPEGFDWKGMDVDWYKLRRFSSHEMILLALGKPSGEALCAIGRTDHEDSFVHFTTDHGSTERDGGIQPGQHQLWFVGEGDISEAMEFEALEARRYRFGKIA